MIKRQVNLFSNELSRLRGHIAFTTNNAQAAYKLISKLPIDKQIVDFGVLKDQHSTFDHLFEDASANFNQYIESKRDKTQDFLSSCNITNLTKNPMGFWKGDTQNRIDAAKEKLKSFTERLESLKNEMQSKGQKKADLLKHDHDGKMLSPFHFNSPLVFWRNFPGSLAIAEDAERKWGGPNLFVNIQAKNEAKEPASGYLRCSKCGQEKLKKLKQSYQEDEENVLEDSSCFVDGQCDFKDEKELPEPELSLDKVLAFYDKRGLLVNFEVEEGKNQMKEFLTALLVNIKK